MGTKSEATVNAEKCRLEIFNQDEEKGKGEGLVSLPTAANETLCSLTIEQPKTKCKVTISDQSEQELGNEQLSALKIKNGKEKTESEIESGSEIKGVQTATSGCTGIAATTEGIFHIKKGIIVKGASLTKAALEISPSGHNFKGIPVGTSSGEAVFNVTANAEVELKPPFFLLNTQGYSIPSNTCTKGILKPTEKCHINVILTPKKIAPLRDAVLLDFKKGVDNWRAQFPLFGKGT